MLGILRSAKAELRMTAQYMSLVVASAASDAAIPSKAATDVRDSSFHRNYSATGRERWHHWANNGFNSIVHQMATPKVAPFRVENPEHRDAS